jgi:hypothetical protein
MLVTEIPNSAALADMRGAATALMNSATAAPAENARVFQVGRYAAVDTAIPSM